MFVSQSSSRALPLIDSGRNVTCSTTRYDLVAPRHVDEPLVDQAEQQLGLAAPAVRIAVRILLHREQHALLLQVVEDPVGRGADRRRTCPSSAPKPGTKTPYSSSGATGGRPSSLPSWKSSLPQPGAMWTMPVPSVSPTSFQAMTRWSSRADLAGAQFCSTDDARRSRRDSRRDAAGPAVRRTGRRTASRPCRRP